MAATIAIILLFLVFPLFELITAIRNALIGGRTSQYIVIFVHCISMAIRALLFYWAGLFDKFFA